VKGGIFCFKVRLFGVAVLIIILVVVIILLLLLLLLLVIVTSCHCAFSEINVVIIKLGK
jgi:hypothetical protein